MSFGRVVIMMLTICLIFMMGELLKKLDATNGEWWYGMILFLAMGFLQYIDGLIKEKRSKWLN